MRDVNQKCTDATESIYNLVRPHLLSLTSEERRSVKERVKRVLMNNFDDRAVVRGRGLTRVGKSFNG